MEKNQIQLTNKLNMNNKIRVGITQGDANGIGYEVIFKAFASAGMYEYCTPIVYGSPKVAAYHRKSLDLSTSFSIINTIDEVEEGKLNVLACSSDEVRVEFGVEDKIVGKAAFDALEKAIQDYNDGLIDVLVTAPINKSTIHSESFNFPGHTEYLEDKVGNGQKSLMILMKEDFRVAVATGHTPIQEASKTLTTDLLKEKLVIFNNTLKEDFGISRPQIAVLGLNPHAGDNGLLGKEEKEVIIPAIKDLSEEGILCYGPFAADGFFGANTYRKFDGILAMYHDQGLIPFKILAMDMGVNYTAGLPLVRTSPAHGTAYEIAGQGVADETSFRQAIYAAIDIFKFREQEEELQSNPLRKQYFNRNDDSDKLDLQSADNDLSEHDY